MLLESQDSKLISELHADTSSLETNNYPQINKFVKGVQKHFIYLTEIAQNLFTNSEQNKWNEYYKNLQQPVKKFSIHLPLNGKKRHLNFLSSIKEECEKNTEILFNGSNSRNLKSQKSTKKEITHQSIIDDSPKNIAHFKEIEEKLNKIKSKIDFCNTEINEPEEIVNQVFTEFQQSLKTKIPKFLVLTETKISLEKDSPRVIKYNQLKSAWLESLSTYMTLIARSTQSLIADYSKTMNEQKIYFDKLMTCFELITPCKLAEGYTEKYQELRKTVNGEELVYKRDLSKGFEDHKTYKISHESYFVANNVIVTGLNNDRQASFNKVKNILSEMTWAIHSLTKQKAIADKELEILENQQNEISQLELVIKALKTLQEEIVMQWNSLFLSLKNINHQITILNDFGERNEQMGLFYLNTEKIHGDLRHLRLTSNNQVDRLTEYSCKLQAFPELRAIFKQISEQNTQERKIFEKNDKTELLKLTTSLIHLTHLVNEKKNVEDIGLIWLTEDDQIKILEEYNNQTVFQNNQYTQIEANIEKSQKTLKTICTWALKELNQEGETLTITTPEYKEDLPSKFYPENLFGRKFYEGIEIGLKYLGYKLPNKEYIKIESPFK